VSSVRPRITIVVPCFNEAGRLDRGEVRALLDEPNVSLVFVDDGSRDDTLPVLRDIARDEPRVRVLPMGENQGKGEAVRAGMNLAMLDADIVGYLDADFSAPAREMLRVIDALRTGAHDVALGSRVALLGRRIERSNVRHYLGRVFATAASATLGLPVYDTQCGAKAFRVTPALRRALVRPFTSRWVFDVELLDRLLHEGVPSSAIVEVPLLEWRDVSGSKLHPWAASRAAWDLARIAHVARTRRRR
jgi:dolichyl-phosphate beta-glucosyltransferase